ncbi:ABC transporter ATP-binding protein [Bacillus halotolerans]|uniref:ATP-binding cassette domain-containing protein n=1 Tax=Bacillus halotolerans TaxID=260554 RepID=UPI001C3D17AF|nr:ABC transporter ATP-binding protein [Bacillus halotolerans]MBV5124286.1 ABC transporter ATP-binding protein [Bacillus halotolerans]MCC2117718.1 ABC transporter ATP-binding protein [Bacillus halotolerans]
MLESIKVVALSKQFGSVSALNEVSIEFKKNKIYAILGHNGAGKTTLIKEILGLNNQENSSINFYDGGRNIIHSPKYMMSFSPEKYILLEDLTVIEYLTFVSKLYNKFNNELKQKMHNLLKLFDLWDYKNKFIFTLSNGMKKKVAHIAALELNTEFTFLDEPFSALDPVSIFNLKQYLINNLNKNSFIICTHQLDLLKNLDIGEDKLELVLFNKGNLVFKGTRNELFCKTKSKSIEDAYLYYYSNKQY